MQRIFERVFSPQKIEGLKVKDIHGRQADIQHLNEAAPYTLLEFWFMGCEPCVRSMQQLKLIYKELKQHGQLIFINTDKQEQLVKRSAAMIKEMDLPWGNFWDQGGSESKKYVQLYAYPSNVLVDGGGSILVKNVRAASVIDFMRSDEVKTLMEAILYHSKMGVNQKQ